MKKRILNLAFIVLSGFLFGTCGNSDYDRFNNCQAQKQSTIEEAENSYDTQVRGDINYAPDTVSCIQSAAATLGIMLRNADDAYYCCMNGCPQTI